MPCAWQLSWIVLLAGAPPACGEGPAPVRNRPAAEIRLRQASGRVVDGAGPTVGARVGFQGILDRANTDSQGLFALLSPRSAERVVASKAGYYVAAESWHEGVGSLEIRLRPHPLEDYREYAWISSYRSSDEPERCGNCHGEILREWSDGAHAQSATNPHFRNLYDGTDWQGNENVGWSLLRQAPEASGVCYSCHVPSLEPDARLVRDLRTTSGVAREGVHCDFCHKIAAVSLAGVGLNHGRFALQLTRPRPGLQVYFGPMDDANRASAVHSPLYRRSQYCAGCHEGIVLGTHAYGEYSEWLASPAFKQGVQCQDCHMRPTGQMCNVAPGRGGIDRDPRTLASHRSTRGDPAVLRRHVLLDLRAERTASAIDVAVEIRVRGVGHRLPTGYPDRALIVWIAAKDAQGRDLGALEGPRLPPAAGDGEPEKGGLFAKPGKMYAKALQGLDGAMPVPFWVPNRVIADTRLLPDQADRLQFRFRAPQGRAEIVARLVYRRFSKYLADQKGWPDTETLVDQRTVRLD